MAKTGTTFEEFARGCERLAVEQASEAVSLANRAQGAADAAAVALACHRSAGWLDRYATAMTTRATVATSERLSANSTTKSARARQYLAVATAAREMATRLGRYDMMEADIEALQNLMPAA